MPGDCPTVVPGGSSVSAEGTLLYPSSEEAVFSEEGEMQTVEVEGTVEEDDKLEESAHCSCCICSNGPLPWEADPNWRPARIAETMDAVRQLAPQVDASEMSFELQGFPYCPNQWGQAGEAELPQTMPKGKFGALGTNLFAFGLPIGWGREKLIEHFRVCGTIVSCRVIKDPKLKKSRGYGFVCFLDHKSTLRALQRLNGLEVGSGSFRKRLRVTIKLGEEKFFLAAMRECDREEKEKVANLDGDAADANTRDSEEKGKRKKRRGARKKAAEKKKAALAEEEAKAKTKELILPPALPPLNAFGRAEGSVEASRWFAEKTMIGGQSGREGREGSTPTRIGGTGSGSPPSAGRSTTLTPPENSLSHSADCCCDSSGSTQDEHQECAVENKVMRGAWGGAAQGNGVGWNGPIPPPPRGPLPPPQPQQSHTCTYQEQQHQGPPLLAAYPCKEQGKGNEIPQIEPQLQSAVAPPPCSSFDRTTTLFTPTPPVPPPSRPAPDPWRFKQPKQHPPMENPSWVAGGRRHHHPHACTVTQLE